MKLHQANPSPLTVGILGGMGPISTAHFYSDILSICQREYGAVEEGDYPPMILYSLPMRESTSKGFENIDAALPQLLPAVTLLQNAGADFIVIPCNTAHYFFDRLQEAIHIPIISMIDKVVVEVERRGYKTVGLMGTHTTVSSGLYRLPCKKAGIRVVNMTDAELSSVATVIGAVTSGSKTAAETDTLRRVAESLAKRGAEGVILGCTELPLVLQQRDISIPLLDSMSLLASASVRAAYDGFSAAPHLQP